MATVRCKVTELGMPGQPTSVWNWQGTVTSAWAALVVAGAGLALPLGARFALLVEGQALVTFPSAMIRIDGAEVGRAGLPALLASAGLLGRF